MCIIKRQVFDNLLTLIEKMHRDWMQKHSPYNSKTEPLLLMGLTLSYPRIYMSVNMSRKTKNPELYKHRVFGSTCVRI